MTEDLKNVTRHGKLNPAPPISNHPQESTGLTEELKNVARHGIKRRFMPSSKFVSDQKLLSILEEMRDELQGNAAIAGEVKKSMAHRNAVLLPGGIELDRVGMARFALKAVLQGKQNQVR